ncbi:MAG: hypothetical protein JW953_14795 [Anaerolineae bacterium]|nr:hypothetical protein [Anaerolineae bacterium]
MDETPDFLEMTSKEENPATPEPVTEAETAPEDGKPTITFRGNGYDIAAVVGVTVGAVMLLSCVTCNLAYYVFPFIPVILGIVGLVLAKDSVNPERTRLLSWFSLGSGAFFFVVAFLCVAAYIGFIVFAIAMDSGGF